MYCRKIRILYIINGWLIIFVIFGLWFITCMLLIKYSLYTEKLTRLLIIQCPGPKLPLSIDLAFQVCVFCSGMFQIGTDDTSCLICTHGNHSIHMLIYICVCVCCVVTKVPNTHVWYTNTYKTIHISYTTPTTISISYSWILEEKKSDWGCIIRGIVMLGVVSHRLWEGQIPS